ncbi:MAG: small multi-drug export protein [Candidatus Latescibacteria bacterium]|nr:small multi-drug export protein [Candidatus Latescibacterota bacterium]
MKYQKSNIKNQKYIYYLLLAISSLLLLGCRGHLKESIINGLHSRGISPELTILITAMLPVIELRGAIPLGINFYNLVWYKVVILAIIGNLLPVLPILFLLDKVSRLLSHISVFRKFFDWLFTRTRKRSKIIEEYKMLGLTLFVAIPLPVTGAWTGSVAAFLLGLKILPSFLAILFGVLIAAVIVTGLSLLRVWGAVIVGLVFLFFIARAVYISRTKNNKKLEV